VPFFAAAAAESTPSLGSFRYESSVGSSDWSAGEFGFSDGYFSFFGSAAPPGWESIGTGDQIEVRDGSTVVRSFTIWSAGARFSVWWEYERSPLRGSGTLVQGRTYTLYEV